MASERLKHLGGTLITVAFETGAGLMALKEAWAAVVILGLAGLEVFAIAYWSFVEELIAKWTIRESQTLPGYLVYLEERPNGSLAPHLTDLQRRVILWARGGAIALGVGLFLGVCYVLYGVIFKIQPAVIATSHQIASANPLDNTILLDCEWTTYPTIVPANGLFDMELIASSPMIGAVVSSSFPAGTLLKKPSNEFPSYTYRCQFSNYGDKPLLKIAANLTVQYFEVLKDAHGTHSGKALKPAGIVSSPVLPIGVGPNNSVDFFVQNFSDNAFVNVALPTEARVERVGSDQWQTVKLAPPNLGGFGMPPFVRPKKP